MYWLMTPGRDDVFGFLMGENGFLYPWPRPRASSVPLRHSAPLRWPRIATAANPGIWSPKDRAEAMDPVERFDIKVLDHPRMARPDSVDHQWRVIHDRPPPLLLRAPRERHRSFERHAPEAPPDPGLTAQQRFLAAAVAHARYVVPVTAHPDLELPEGAPAESWERFEPHVDRVQAPHNILAWDRHVPHERDHA